MDRRHLLGYGLVALGLLALLARVSGSTGWLWLGVVAGASLAAYLNTRTYGFLLLGGVLAGSSLGLLLTDLFRFDGVFLVALGAGLIVVDLVEPRASRLATYLGATLAAIGLIAGLADSGVLGSAWLPILLIGIGLALLWRDRSGEREFPPPLRPVPPSSAPDPPTSTGVPPTQTEDEAR